jgi:hypothetical protein
MESKMKKMNLIKKIVVTGTVAALSVAMLAGSVLAGQFVTNEKGTWYDNGDGTYPSNTWKWIDADGDGNFESYAFDENGYLYVNTTTPDGYTTDATGSWVQNGIKILRTAYENLSDSTIVSKAVQSLKNASAEEVLNAINSINGVTGVKYGTTSKVTTLPGGNVTTTNAGEIATTKYTVTRKAAEGTEAVISEPDMSKTSFDTNGPSVPAEAVSTSGAPLTDNTTLNVAGPDGSVDPGSN